MLWVALLWGALSATFMAFRELPRIALRDLERLQKFHHSSQEEKEVLGSKRTQLVLFPGGAVVRAGLRTDPQLED